MKHRTKCLCGKEFIYHYLLGEFSLITFKEKMFCSSMGESSRGEPGEDSGGLRTKVTG